MTIPTDNASPLHGTSTTKPGQTVRAPYRFFKRKHRTSDPSSKGVLFSKRSSARSLGITRSFRVAQTGVAPSCLAPMPNFSPHAQPPRRACNSFVNAAVGTRTHIHVKGQLESGKRLLARLRIGFTEMMRAFSFAKSYFFTGQPGVQQQALSTAYCSCSLCRIFASMHYDLPTPLALATTYCSKSLAGFSLIVTMPYFCS